MVKSVGFSGYPDMNGGSERRKKITIRFLAWVVM